MEAKGKTLLIDTSPDLRQQALRAGIARIDAVLYTHDHADHTGGIDDLRAFNVRADAAIPVYGSAETLNLLKSRYSYAFLEKPPVWYRPCLLAHAFPAGPVFDYEVQGVTFTAFEQQHGKIKTYGYRFGDFVYSTDVDALSETAFAALQGVDTWIVDCLRYGTSYTHAHLERTLEWIARVKPRMAILTHMAHDFDYQTLLRELPAGVVPGYDGIVLQF